MGVLYHARQQQNITTTLCRTSCTFGLGREAFSSHRRKVCFFLFESRPARVALETQASQQQD